ncbi:hypothetical protein TNCV_4079321 [Trichonephila clavipes]|nr:hypothetical protein TNCV_4079321 [Trichonephila clavipes]
MLDSRTPLYVLDAGTVNSQSYRNEIREVYYSFPPRTPKELKVPLSEEWALLPQILIDTLINSMAARFEVHRAVHSEHTPYWTDFPQEGLGYELVASMSRVSALAPVEHTRGVGVPRLDLGESLSTSHTRKQQDNWRRHRNLEPRSETRSEASPFNKN